MDVPQTFVHVRNDEISFGFYHWICLIGDFFADATIGFITIKNPPFERISRCLFQIFVYFQPYVGKIPILTHMFEMGMGFSTTNQIFTYYVIIYDIHIMTI